MPEIRAWLEGLGLGQYAGVFEAECIETGDLPNLTEADLQQLGIPMGPRKRLLRALSALPGAPSNEAEVAGPSLRPKYAPVPLAEKILGARATIEGEKKQVTVLFADVKGSTELVQHLDAEQVSALFDPLQKIMMDAVHVYEGTVNEVLGDGLMAIFGAPIAHEDHALRACRAALDMQDQVSRWVGQSAEEAPARSIGVRVGLNSGEVVVRAINNDLTISYSAMGLTTHLAARMEQIAEAGAILITDATFRLARGLIEVKPQGEVAIKGLAQPIHAYHLHGLARARTRLEAATTAGLTRFVGRARELRMLEERFAEAEAGHGQAVSIIGDPGIGKSRLLLELRSRIEQRAAWLEGHAASFGQAMAFHPLIDLLRRNFHIDEKDHADAFRQKIARAVTHIGSDLGFTLPYIFYLLGAAEVDDPVHRLDPQVRRAESFDALRHLLLRAAERKPQVLVFEDLHWSDKATRDFLSSLIDSIPRCRALILLTFRPGYDFVLEDRTYAMRLILQALSVAEAGEMAGAVLASEELPDELRALVQRKAEGNPFFVEEVIKALSETGAIRRRGERWVLSRPLDEIVVPDTIQDVLMSRIDRLDEEPRQALQLAAVIGREFTQRLLDRIVHVQSGTTRVLRELQAIELIYEKALFPELAFMFKHALTQDVAYGSLLSHRRRVLHRRIGEAIEQLYADRLAEHYALLGRHFASGEVWARAATYFEKAADQAAASFAAHEALALYREAIDALDRGGTGGAARRKQADLHARMGDLYMSLSDFHRAHQEQAEAAACSREVDDPAGEGSATAGMALASAFAHDFPRGLAEADRARRLAETTGCSVILPAAHFTTGVIQLLTGRLDKAETSLRTSHAMSKSQGQLLQSAHTSLHLAFLHNWRGDLDLSVLTSDEIITTAEDHHLAFVLIQALFARGLARTARGDHEDARATLTDGLTLAEKLGSEFFRCRFLNSLGWLHAECGDLTRAVAFNERGFDAARKRQDPETLANCELNLADVYWLEGDFQLAQEYLDSTYALVSKPSTSDWMKWRYSQHLFAGLGELWLALDHPAKADPFCNQCLELATRTGSKKYLARGWRLKGRLAISHLQMEEAEEALRKSLCFAERVGNPTELWKSHLALGQLHRKNGRVDPARLSLSRARHAIEGIGQRLHDHELRNGFAHSPVFRDVLEQCNAD